VAELTSLLERELDLTHERANIQRLTALAGEDSRIRFPRVHSELSTARVLTTEYLGGIPLADIFSPARRMDLALEDSGFDADELAGNLMQSTLRQMFEYHFYNADPHPRNLLFAPGNAIGYAEFGLCEKLDQSTAREVARFLGEIHRPDLPQMFRVLLALAVPADGADVEKLKVEFMAESHRWLGNVPPVLAAHRSSDSRPPTARWMVGIMQALRRNEFRLPREILASFQTLVTAETLAYRLAPSVHLRTVGREFFTDLQLAETFRFIDPAVQQNLIVKLLIALRDAPEHLNEILSELAEGRFTINLSATEYPPSAKARDQRARLIAAAVVSVAIAYLLAEGGLPAIGRVPASIILGIMLGLLYIYIFVQWRRLQ
jgi:ubiquinone biosynthesis protein